MKLIVEYKDLDTDLDSVYSGVLKEMRSNNDLDIVREFKGDKDGRVFRTIVAVRADVPRAFVGALREVTFTITGTPNDHVIEIHTGSWFNTMVSPGLENGPFGGVLGPPGMAAGMIVGSETSSSVGSIYHRKLSNKVAELVSVYSKYPITVHNMTII